MLRQKPNQVLPQMLLKEATIHFYCLLDESCFSDNCTIKELKELNWLWRHMKNVRSSQPCISMNVCTESSSSIWVSLIELNMRNNFVYITVSIYHCNSFKVSYSFFLYATLRTYRNVLKPNCRPLAFTLYNAFFKIQKEVWDWSPCLIFCRTF